MRAYPKGTRITSNNLDPAPFWRQGVQMVALNWQYINEATMLNHAMFEKTGGWVLKPEGYRSHHPANSQATGLRRGMLNLSIEIFAGQNIGPADKRLKLYIRCELHIEDEEENLNEDLLKAGQSREGQIKVRTEVVRSGNNPDFARQTLSFKDVPDVAEEMTFVRYVFVLLPLVSGFPQTDHTCHLCMVSENSSASIAATYSWRIVANQVHAVVCIREPLGNLQDSVCSEMVLERDGQTRRPG